MTDVLMELSKNPQARRLIKSLGLPIPMPTPLKRPRGPREARPLEGRRVAVGFDPSSTLSGVLSRALVEAGATVCVSGLAPAELHDASEAFGRPWTTLSGEPDEQRIDAIVFDGTAIETTEGLNALHAFFHPIVRGISRCGRIAVISRPVGEQKTPASAGAQAALEGFVRSLSKEIGKKGSTATLLEVAQGAESRLAGPLRFLLSSRSTYVTGQPIRVSKRVRATKGEHSWTLPLEGKRALVTGAARGIGLATARILAAEGARVFCLDRPEDQGAAAKLAREIGGVPVGVDISNPEAPELILEALDGAVDIVVHNAGITRDRTLARMSPEWWSQTLDINLGAVERITGRLIESGALQTGGRVVCLSSVSGIAGNMGQTNYSASKAGVMGLVGAYSASLARRGITVNGIAPGFIETRMTAAMPVAIREVARRMNSLGQAGQPEDVGEAIAFLVGPDASGVTGQVLRVCGGALIGA